MLLLHQPKGSKFLFPKVARLASDLLPTLEKLEQDRRQGERLIRALQHHLGAWEMIGDSRPGPAARSGKVSLVGAGSQHAGIHRVLHGLDGQDSSQDRGFAGQPRVVR